MFSNDSVGNKNHCVHCVTTLDERYLVNEYENYFCSEECYEKHSEIHIQLDEDHPYYFDYSTIRRDYLDWLDNWEAALLNAIHSNRCPQWVADELVDDVDDYISGYDDYIAIEGDDGIFASEIYDYTQKLEELQKLILQWRPVREIYYGIRYY
jgi:hypothetical protein